MTKSTEIDWEMANNTVNQIIDEIRNLDVNGHWHERYLHHRFSFLMQESNYDISFDNQKDGTTFHTEWATCMKYGRSGGCYAKDEDGNYVPKEQLKQHQKKESNEGTPGFIDFAIGGVFDHPSTAVEFKLADDIDVQGYSFDYLKLLDNRNQFDYALSLSIIKGRKTKVESEMLNNCLQQAFPEEYRKYYDSKKERRFIVIQLLKGNMLKWEHKGRNINIENARFELI